MQPFVLHEMHADTCMLAVFGLFAIFVLPRLKLDEEPAAEAGDAAEAVTQGREQSGPPPAIRQGSAARRR